MSLSPQRSLLHLLLKLLVSELGVRKQRTILFKESTLGCQVAGANIRSNRQRWIAVLVCLINAPFCVPLLDMRTRYNADSNKSSSSPTNSYDNVIADQEAIFSTEDKSSHVFNERPFCTYQGHTSDVLDICWAKVILNPIDLPFLLI